MVLKYLLVLLLSFPTLRVHATVSASIDEKCEAALKTLFAESVSKDQASTDRFHSSCYLWADLTQFYF